MAKGKGGASGFGATDDNVHSGPGSKGHGSSTGTPRVSGGGKGGGGATEKTHNVEFAKGGSGKNNTMFSEQAAESETKNGMAGHTGDPTASDNAPGDKFATGGKDKMFGFNPAVTAAAGITSAR